MGFLVLFAASFAWVYLQGFQSQSVNGGEYRAAAIGSFALGFTQVYVLASVIKAEDLLHTFVYCCGGSLGIVAAMKTKAILRSRKAAP